MFLVHILSQFQDVSWPIPNFVSAICIRQGIPECSLDQGGGPSERSVLSHPGSYKLSGDS